MLKLITKAQTLLAREEGATAVEYALLVALIAVAIIAIAIWRTPRSSIDFVGRQAAMATVPDNQRARLSNVINVVPVGLGFTLVAGPIGISRLLDNRWVAPVIAVALALLAIVAGRKVLKTWDDTQLSYRLKRRKRLG